jgi:DNA mismatch repair protein MutL
MALAYPRVHFRLHHDARTVADYVSVSDPKDRLTQVLGHDAAKGLASFRWNLGELGVHGFLSSAPISYPNARYLFTFVNRRYVRDRVLTHAVMFGYETLLMKGQYPAVVLCLELPFGQVDVNVHPAKYEVRFRRQSEVHQVVAGAIRQALRREAKEPGPMRFTAPAEFASVGEAAVPYRALTASMCGEPLSVGDPLSGWPPRPEETPGGFFSSLRILGQIFGCYLVCASADGLALIDQHAAHERVAFEKLRRQLEAGKVESQTLLIPETVELSPGEIMLLEENLAVMERFGVVLEPFGPGCYEITAVPALLPAGDSRQVVRQMIAELAEVDVSARLRQRLEDRLATIACHSVVRANRALEIDEIRALLGDLDRIEFATQCPHGRPVLRQFRRDELEKLFKRIA